jgi:hypothetical protein
VREAVGQIGETSGKKDKEIYEAAGVETDEVVGISIKPFDDRVNGILKQQKACAGDGLLCGSKLGLFTSGMLSEVRLQYTL